MPHFGERRILLRSERIVRSAFFSEGGDPFQKKLRRLGHGGNHGFLMLAPEPGQLTARELPGGGDDALLQLAAGEVSPHYAKKAALWAGGFRKIPVNFSAILPRPGN